MTSVSVFPADHGLNITANGTVVVEVGNSRQRGWEAGGGGGGAGEVEALSFNPSLEIAWNVRGGEASWKPK